MNTSKSQDSVVLAAIDRSTTGTEGREPDSKQTVLDAAQRLINQYGFTGFSMRDLAEQSGLAKATLYHHFADKREIFMQVLQRDLAYVSDHLAAAAASPGSLALRLEQVALAFFAVADERGVLLMSTLRQAAGMENEFCTLMRDYRQELHRPIVELLQDAIADGSCRAIDVEMATMSFFGILQVFVSRRLLMKDIELDDHVARFIVDYTLNGIAHPTPKST